MIFVFGSNEAGIHGAGAAKVAHKQKGAKWGVGVGPTGDCYAIPTKDKYIKSLSLDDIQGYVHQFLGYARSNPTTKFQVTQIGCGLAGFTPDQIAPLFTDAPPNCLFDEAWKTFLRNKSFWGTF